MKTNLYYWEYINKHPNFTGCIIDAEGAKVYYKNGMSHREDGPAVEWTNGYKAYFKNGLRHREDGPAVENSNGDKSYYLNNNRYSYEEWLKLTNKSSITEIKLYKTTDNQTFNTKEEAETHQKELAFSEWYKNNKIPRVSEKTIVDWLKVYNEAKIIKNLS